MGYRAKRKSGARYGGEKARARFLSPRALTLFIGYLGQIDEFEGDLATVNETRISLSW